MGQLTATEIKLRTTPGRYIAGDGLILNIAPGGSKSWILRVRVEGGPRDIGLGSTKVRYVHHFIDFSASSGPNERVQNGAGVFDHRRFTLKRNRDRGEILDRLRFTVTPVKGQVLEALDKLNRAPPLTEASTLVRSEELLLWLAQKQFLIDRDGAQKHSR